VNKFGDLQHIPTNISEVLDLPLQGWGVGGALLYIGFIGMCGPKGNIFLAVLVRNRLEKKDLVFAFLSWIGYLF